MTANDRIRLKPRSVGLGAVAAAALMLCAGGGVASAASVLTLTNQYNPCSIVFQAGTSTHTASGGGAMLGATLDGSPVAYLYCLEWQHSVLVPATYNNTVVSTTGQIHGADLPLGGTGVFSTYSAAEQIAWSMKNLASLAATGTGALDKQAGLQALIWSLVTPGFSLTSGTSVAITNAFNTYSTALANARNNSLIGSLDGQVLFITPPNNGSTLRQALVGYTPDDPRSVPEPSTLYGAALAGIVGIGYARRRRKA